MDRNNAGLQRRTFLIAIAAVLAFLLIPPWHRVLALAMIFGPSRGWLIAKLLIGVVISFFLATIIGRVHFRGRGIIPRRWLVVALFGLGATLLSLSCVLPFLHNVGGFGGLLRRPLTPLVIALSAATLLTYLAERRWIAFDSLKALSDVAFRLLLFSLSTLLATTALHFAWDGERFFYFQISHRGFKLPYATNAIWAMSTAFTAMLVATVLWGFALLLQRNGNNALEIGKAREQGGQGGGKP